MREVLSQHTVMVQHWHHAATLATDAVTHLTHCLRTCHLAELYRVHGPESDTCKTLTAGRDEILETGKPEHVL